MFDPDSRYDGLPTATHVTPSGTEIVYVTRRFLPRATDLVPLGRVLVTDGDRLDRVAARTLGDPLLWWRVADAGEAMNPADLVATPGAALLIAEDR